MIAKANKKKPKAVVQLWVRTGDGADYQAYGDDMHSLVDHLREAGVTLPLHWQGCGFVCHDFEGNNYVSLFWGDDKGNLVRVISDVERQEIKELLRESV